MALACASFALCVRSGGGCSRHYAFAIHPPSVTTVFRQPTSRFSAALTPHPPCAWLLRSVRQYCIVSTTCTSNASGVVNQTYSTAAQHHSTIYRFIRIIYNYHYHTTVCAALLPYYLYCIHHDFAKYLFHFSLSSHSSRIRSHRIRALHLDPYSHPARIAHRARIGCLFAAVLYRSYNTVEE